MPRFIGYSRKAVFLSHVIPTALLVLGSHASAQVVGGTLRGTMTDPTGAAVSGGSVVISNTQTKIETRIVTGSNGSYLVPNLIPGTYSVTGSSQGFASTNVIGVTISVGAQEQVDLKLAVGPANSEIVVTSPTESTLQFISSGLSQQITGQTIRDLPLNGRSWTDLAELQPGVVPISQNQPTFVGQPDRGNRGYGNQISISGARPQQNNYRLDGVSINDYANGAPGAVTGGNLGVDAMQGFQLFTTNAPAEYGRSAGGIVNGTTRSGTNAFHGELYEFVRNNVFDAKNYFTSSGTSSPFRRNQFGGAIGGPILKDRTFFFVNYEGLRQAQTLPFQSFVPSDNARAGLIVNADGTSTTYAVDPAAAQYLALYPHANSSISSGDANTGIYNISQQNAINEDFVVGRVDHYIGAKDSISGSYLYDRSPYTYPDQLGDVLLGSTSIRQLVVLEETHSFTRNLINSLRFGFNRDAVSNGQVQAAINPAAATVPGPVLGRGAAQVSINSDSITSLTGGTGAQGDRFHWNSFQVYDDAVWTKGKHALKFGFAFEHMQLNSLPPGTPTGLWTFNTLANFLTNTPATFNSNTSTGYNPLDFRESLFGGYIQDDWRVTPRLTVNLGVRYEMVTVPTETAGRLSVLRNLTDATPHLGNPYFSNPTTKDFSPRIGFAWDPFGNSKTAVHGGFGIYDVLPLPYQFYTVASSAAPYELQLQISDPAQLKGQFYSASSFMNTPASQIPSSQLQATYFDPSPKRNYVMQYHLDVQQALGGGFTAQLAYVGNHGLHQPFYSDEFDLALPDQSISTGGIWSAANTRQKVNPNFGGIRGFMDIGSSVYNGLQASLTKRLEHNLEMQASFTWSRATDISSGSISSDATNYAISNPPYWAPARMRGLSDYNMSKIFVLSATYALPKMTNMKALAPVVNGWQLNGAYHLNTGTPFSEWVNGYINVGGNTINDFPNVSSAAGCKSLTNPGNITNYIKTQCFSDPGPNTFGNERRNSLISPGNDYLDAALFKTFQPTASDRFKLQFRAEFFNALNHPNFSAPSNTSQILTVAADGQSATVNPSSGIITSTSVNNRQIQFGLKGTF